MTTLIFASLILGAPDAQTREAVTAGQFDVAQERLLKKRSTGVWDMDDQLTLAAVCLGKGDMACAEFLYQETLKPEPRHALAYFGLAEVARRRGELVLASQFYAAYLSSDLPGRSIAFDQVAEGRVRAIGSATSPRSVIGRKIVSKPPSFGQLSLASSRWASLAFFPAIFGGVIAGALVDEMNLGRNSDLLPMLSGLAVGSAIFGGGIAWGINRKAARYGYTGAALQAGFSGIAAPLIIGVGGAFTLGNGDFDPDLVGTAMLVGMVAAVSFVPPWVYMTDLRPLGAEAGSGNAEGGVPSVVGR